ncbi:unnamed protein product [Miscanthus lutarioriparius]|uniref:MATH domain-containing protein n=1 Tax=Miscanthus lutarioriparius TaxID=422564 RepID=A0A811S4K8_9POAL|nr:unnamed protein product [Miscanthus lutarioriparius]
MKPATAITKITEAARSVQLLQIDGYSATESMSQKDYIGSTWNVDGYEWEVRVYPEYDYSRSSWVALRLIILSKPRTVEVRAHFTGRLVDPSGRLQPSEGDSISHKRDEIAPGYLENDSLTVECAITVLRELPEVVFPATKEEEVPPPTPSSDLHKHLGELLRARRAPTSRSCSRPVASGFRRTRASSPRGLGSSWLSSSAAWRSGPLGSWRSRTWTPRRSRPCFASFVYTDVAPPELDDDEPAAAVTMAQNLLAAADRYGLDRLKAICEAKLAGRVDVGTAATTLALAEQHGCALLKAKCVDFVTGSTETLDAVLATEGYAHLAASCPLVLAELLKSARGRKN